MIGTAVGGIASAAGSEQAEELQEFVTDDQIRSERQIAQAEAGALERQQSAQFADIQAANAASGFDPTTGSIADVNEQMVQEMALNRANVIFGGDLRVSELKQGKALDKYTSKLDRVTTLISAGTKSFAQGYQGYQETFGSDGGSGTGFGFG